MPPSPTRAESLEDVATALQPFQPRVLAVVGPSGETIAAWAPEGAVPISRKRLRVIVAEAFERVRAGYPISEWDASLGCHRIGILERTGAAHEFAFVGWFARDPTADVIPLERTLVAARIAVRAIRFCRDLSRQRARTRHLQNERDALTTAHNRVVAEMLKAKEQQASGQKRYVERLEEEVERRSSDLHEALRQAERANDAKNSFLANISHEIRTPMTTILGYTDLILDPELTRSELEEHAEIIRTNGEHLLAILDDILATAKIEAEEVTLDPVEFDVRDLVEEVVSTLKTRADEVGVYLVADFRGPIPAQVYSDPVRIRQILVNLVGNALKFTERGGVRIVTRYRRNEGAELLDFEVIDTGTGMTAEQLDGLFEPLPQAGASTTRRFGGAGLGLATSRNLAELLGGEISAQSVPGRGSTFRLTVELGQEVAVPIARHENVDLQTGIFRRPELEAGAAESEREPEPASAPEEPASPPLETEAMVEEVGAWIEAGPPADGRIVSSYAEDSELREIVQEFLDEFPLRIALLRSCVEENNFQRARELAAELKREGEAVGFDVLHHKGEELEGRCLVEDADAAPGHARRAGDAPDAPLRDPVGGPGAGLFERTGLLGARERTEERGKKPHHDRAEKRPAEARDVEARHEHGGKREEDRVQDEIEDPERQDRDRQGEEHEHGLQHRVQEAEHEGREQQRGDGLDRHAGQDPGGGGERDRHQEPVDEKRAHAASLLHLLHTTNGGPRPPPRSGPVPPRSPHPHHASGLRAELVLEEDEVDAGGRRRSQGVAAVPARDLLSSAHPKATDEPPGDVVDRERGPPAPPAGPGAAGCPPA